jgi:hypothetical protein
LQYRLGRDCVGPQIFPEELGGWLAVGDDEVETEEEKQRFHRPEKNSGLAPARSTQEV